MKIQSCRKHSFQWEILLLSTPIKEVLEAYIFISNYSTLLISKLFLLPFQSLKLYTGVMLCYMLFDQKINWPKVPIKPVLCIYCLHHTAVLKVSIRY